MDDPEIIKLMVSFFYHFEYYIGESFHVKHIGTADNTLAPRSPLEAVTNAKVFAAAIKYQVDGLRDLVP